MLNPGHAVMQLLYSLLLYLGVPLLLARLAWLGLSDSDYLKGWRERFGHAGPRDASKPLVWVHAVSVGEVQAARPLLDYLQRRSPEVDLLLTTTTPNGARTAAQAYAAGVARQYFPYDLPHVVTRFLDSVRPSLLIIMETEIWPNLYRECRRRGIPVALVNARLSERSCRGYRRIGGLTARTLRCLSLVAAQSRADADRFVSLGADPATVRVTGNLKFDISQPHSTLEAGEVMRRFFSVNRPVWLAASTHDGEERIVLDAFTQVLERQPACLLVLAPRHPERAAEVGELCRKFGFLTVYHSQNGEYSAQTRVYIVDTLGELPVFYAASDIGFVGGSLTPLGGHNMLEPASLGVPVLAGPHLFNFAEVSELLASAEALEQVSTANELAGKVCELLDDANLRHAIGERGKQVVRNNQGTLARLIDALTELFPFSQPPNKSG